MEPSVIENRLESFLQQFTEELRMAIRQVSFSPNGGTETTQAVLSRMRAYYNQQDAFKLILDKHKIASGADFFVETVVFYLKSYLLRQEPLFQVHSELAVKPKRGALHPDISIWKNDRLMAVVECKTQLGWNRHGWRAQYFERKQKIQEDFPNAKTFLISMTEVNWDGFSDDPLVGREFFTLSRIHPGGIIKGEEARAIVNPIELLLDQLVDTGL